MTCPNLINYQTLNFKRKIYDEIFLEELEDSYKMGLLSSDKNFLNYVENREDIENNYIMQCSVHSKAVEGCYDDLQNIYDAFDLDTAVGEDLENIGLLVGIEKPEAKPSHVDLTFYLKSPIEYDLIIPAETIVTSKSNGGVSYYTTKDVKIVSGDTEVTVGARTVSLGVKFAGDDTYGGSSNTKSSFVISSKSSCMNTTPTANASMSSGSTITTTVTDCATGAGISGIPVY